MNIERWPYAAGPETGEEMMRMSIAISLKRIADTLEQMMRRDEKMRPYFAVEQIRKD